MEKRGRPGKCEESSGKVWWKTKCRSKETKLNLVEKRDFRRGELSGKYMAKMLYGWDNGKFEKEYLKKLERN